MSNKPPIEVPQGAIRLNTDSQRLEFFAQDRWYEMATDTPVLDGGVGRGFVAGGNVPGGKTNGIQSINFSTLATDTAFGDITSARGGPAGAASRTRGIVAGGGEPSRVNKIDFFAMTSRFSGISASDFGDLTQGRSTDGGGLSSETRAVIAGGTTPSNSNVIDFITIASTGDAVDFGDLIGTASQCGGVSSPTRGIFFRPNTNLDFVTIATTGDAQDFGDLPLNAAACGNGYGNVIRGEYSGGNPSSPSTARQSFIFTTKGEASKFGDLIVTRNNHMAASSPTRCIVAGGTVSGSPSNQIEYVNPTTSGVAVDTNTSFANAPSGAAGLSNAHGGL